VANLERRVEDLERRTPPVRPRDPGVSFEDFVRSMVADLTDVALHDIARRAAPWLAALSHVELQRLIGAIDRRRAQGATP
jgi:hypothetical protein